MTLLMPLAMNSPRPGPYHRRDRPSARGWPLYARGTDKTHAFPGGSRSNGPNAGPGRVILGPVRAAFAHRARELLDFRGVLGMRNSDRRRQAGLLSAAAAAFGTIATVPAAHAQAPYTTWQAYGGGSH